MPKTTLMPPEISSFPAQLRRQAFPVIIKAGLIAGALDITAAFVTYVIKTGKNPSAVLNFVASGIFGKAAFTGNPWIPVWGLLFHFLIATIFAAIFYFAWPVFRRVSKSWVVLGLLYGVFVWLAMNLVVVPLSNTPPLKSTVSGKITSVLILMVCIGLPIAGIVYKRRQPLKSAL